MDHKTPCCSRCKVNYYVGDIRGPKIPILLTCGHDMCRNCLRLMYKKTKRIVCEVCQAVDNTKIDCDDHIINLPIHYYVIGKVWYLWYLKHIKINRDISNLRMTNRLDNTLEIQKKMCQVCYDNANYFCHECNDVYCADCMEEVHIENQLMSKHQIEVINNNINLPQECRCDEHLKVIDFICLTCQLQICSICAIGNHRPHDIHPLEKYNLSKVQRINEYTSKGTKLLRKLKQYKDHLNARIQKSQNRKHSKTEDIKRNLNAFIAAVVGTLQSKEYALLNLLDKAELANLKSLSKIINQLNFMIKDLQTKLNTVDLLLKNNQYSSTMFVDTVSDIERILDSTYYIVKKNKINKSVVCDSKLFDAIQQCINFNIDVDDTYLMEYSLDFPSDYILSHTITVANDDIPERPSSVSSVSTLSSNFSYASEINEPVSYNFNYPSVRMITKNIIEAVIVSHINSPSDFYLKLLANNPIITKICDEIYKFVQTEHSSVKEIEMNNVMYAVKMSTNQWSRGVVSHIIEEEGVKFYTIHCIDYGFMETLTADRIKKIPTSVISIPPLAFNCALYDLKPNAETGWSNEAYTLFHNLMTEKTGVFFVYPLETNFGELYEVDVVWKEYIYPLSVRDAMFFLGHATYEYYVNDTLHEELVNKITLPNDLVLETEAEYPVVLSHFISPNEFYLRISENYELNEIMKTLELIYKPTENNMHKSYLLYTPQIGMAVAARFSVDGDWYRAKIISLPEPRMVTVFYIDFGNLETLPWDQLRVLDKKLIKTPPLAIKASLANIIPANDGIICNDWSFNAGISCMNLLKTNQYIEDNLTALICKVDCLVHKVILFNRTSRGEFCINNRLVTQGYAVPQESEKSFSNYHLTRKPVKREITLPKNRRNQSEEESSDDSMAFIKQRSVIENENHEWEKNKRNKNVPGIKMFVSKIISPSDITLRYVDHDFVKFTNQINKEYNTSKTKKLKNNDWKINDLCAIFIQKFGNWYRGKILKLNNIKKTVSVNCYDLDETCDEVPMNTLHVLDHKFASAKSRILHCGMNDLIPLGVSNEMWSQYSCDRLIEELKKYPYVFFLSKRKINNQSLGEIWIKKVEKPRPLEPINERWINMNKFMVEQGLALNNTQSLKDEVYSSSQSDPEFNNLYESFENTNKNTKAINSWLPPVCFCENQFDATATYVDINCHVYIQKKDYETIEKLKLISNQLNSKFSGSKPEPLNTKWTEGKMIICQYHLDSMWYRATILKKNENKEYVVQFLDFGNIETCSHDDLRSTLYMTDIPQLCFKGYFNGIKPKTKNNKWTIPTLDFIHSIIVDQPCKVLIDFDMSTNNLYSIQKMTIHNILDLHQHLVSQGHAYFDHINVSSVNLFSDGDYDFETIDIKVNSDNFDSLSTKSINKNCEPKYESLLSSTNDSFEEPCFMEFCLLNETVEGTMCSVIGPTKLTLMITKIDGVNITLAKDDMHNNMLIKCGGLPALKKIVPGMSVVVLHNSLWRRGMIIDMDLLLLVDIGKFTKPVLKNLRLCPSEFFDLPMYSITCVLVNVKMNENANAEEVIATMSNMLRDVNLKIVVTNKSNDVVGVELYNDKGKIAYQSLIDSQKLIPK